MFVIAPLIRIVTLLQIKAEDMIMW